MASLCSYTLETIGIYSQYFLRHCITQKKLVRYILKGLWNLPFKIPTQVCWTRSEYFHVSGILEQLRNQEEKNVCLNILFLLLNVYFFNSLFSGPSSHIMILNSGYQFTKALQLLRCPFIVSRFVSHVNHHAY